MALGFSIINSLDESSGLSTPTTIIRMPADGSHWSAPNHVFGENTAVGVSESKSDYDYNYKTLSQIWKESKEFERQNELTTFGLDYYCYGHNKRKNHICN